MKRIKTKEIQPKKLIAKIPMKQIVIDEEHSCFMYYIENNKVKYSLIAHLFKEG
jgi:hypothetical protein